MFLFTRECVPNESYQQLQIATLNEAGVDPSDEARLLSIVSRYKTQSITRAAAISRLIGAGIATKRSLPLFKALALSPNVDDQSSGLAGVEYLLGAKGIGVYRQMLKSPHVKYKWSMFDAQLWRYGTREDVPTAIRLLKQRYASRPKMDYFGWSSPATVLLRYIIEFASDREANEVIEWLRQRKNRLTECDRISVPRAIPSFADPAITSWIALVGGRSLLCERLFNSCLHERFGTIPLFIMDRNCKKRANRAARVATHVVTLNRSWLNHPSIHGSVLLKSSKVLVLEAPGPLQSDRMADIDQAQEDRNLQRLRKFVSGCN